jgi:hypothetical protein
MPDGCMIHLELRRQERGWDLWPDGSAGPLAPLMAVSWPVVVEAMEQFGLYGPFPPEPGDGISAMTFHVKERSLDG